MNDSAHLGKHAVKKFLLAISLLFQHCSAANVVSADVFGTSELHQVENEIASVAKESTKDISYQEHEKLLNKVSNEIVGKVNDLSDLATLAIWANLNLHSDEFAGGYINYNHVIRTARTAALEKIGQNPSPDAEKTLWRVARQLNLDSKVVEEVEAQMSAIKKAPFKFTGRLDFHFEDPQLQKLPMTPEFAEFRNSLCDEIYRKWESHLNDEKTMVALATFVIDADRQITNIKITTTSLKKSKDPAQAQKFEESVMTALQKCSIKNQLPGNMKKVRMQVDFFGS